jgi:hypothetical protein
LNAGTIWEALNQNGPSNIDGIVKSTGLRRELVYGALGWLGRENKINIERCGRAMVFSLREQEPRLNVIEDTIKSDSKPQEKSTRRMRNQPKKTTKAKKITKARKVKAPIEQSERMEEFLLH